MLVLKKLIDRYNKDRRNTVNYLKKCDMKELKIMLIELHEAEIRYEDWKNKDHILYAICQKIQNIDKKIKKLTRTIEK